MESDRPERKRPDIILERLGFTVINMAADDMPSSGDVAEPIDLEDYDVAVPDVTSGTALNMVEQQEKRRRVMTAMTALTERQKFVLTQRAGLDGPPKTFAQIAKVLGISIHAVVLLERRAFRNFRRSYKHLFGGLHG